MLVCMEYKTKDEDIYWHELGNDHVFMSGKAYKELFGLSQMKVSSLIIPVTPTISNTTFMPYILKENVLVI